MLLQNTAELLLLLHVPPPDWYESLIACISMAASCISVLSQGCFLEQDIPREMTWAKQFSVLFLVLLLLLLQVSVCSHIVVSAISRILLGTASEGERTPVSPGDGRLSATTRRCLPQHLTPSQLQYAPPSVLLFQEASALLLPPTAASLKASSAASSSALAAGSVEKNMEEVSSSSKHAERMSMLVALVGLWGIDGLLVLS